LMLCFIGIGFVHGGMSRVGMTVLSARAPVWQGCLPRCQPRITRSVARGGGLCGRGRCCYSRRDTLAPPYPQRARRPVDIAVDPVPPPQLPLNRPIGGTPAQQAALQADIAAAQNLGATDIRVNQAQVNAQGVRVGRNRPDLQYTIGTDRYHIEYDNMTPSTYPNSPRGRDHADRILANDPAAEVILRTY
jgi:hypothetical protein